MDLSIAIQCKIKKLMKEQHISSYQLSISSGLHPSTLNSFLSGKVKLLKMDSLLHYCEALHLELWEFFKDPIFDEVISE